MSITQIILGSLNIIAAGVMLWFAAQSSYARMRWYDYMHQYEVMRDGMNTGEWITSLGPAELQTLRSRIKIDESTFYMLPPADRAAIVAKLRGATEGGEDRPASEEEIRSAIAGLFWHTGQRTLVTRNGQTKQHQVQNDKDYQDRNPASKLLVTQQDLASPESNKADIVKLAAAVGPRGFTKLVRAAIEQQYPRIQEDIRDAASRLYFTRARLADVKAQQAKVQEDVKALAARRDVEQQLLAQAEAENLARRREITRLQADVEEALASYTTALGRELDRQRLYADLKLKVEQTVGTNDKLINEIQKKELGTQGTP